MFLNLSKLTTAAALAASAAVLLAALPADAKDWKRSMNRHYSAAEATKFTPRGDNPRWGFTLSTVVDEMAWRERTAEMLRDAPKPGVGPRWQQPHQLTERPARLNFRF